MAQAELAKEAGVTAFCYWHYWFGNGKQLLERPLQEVVKLGEPDFPFMLGWANHSWISTSWNTKQSSLIPEILIEQKYPGEQDIIDHFNTMLPVFKDKRYLRIHGRLPFLIYAPQLIPDFEKFKTIWNNLAIEKNLPKFFFIAHTELSAMLELPVFQKADAVCFCRVNPFLFDSYKLSLSHRIVNRLKREIYNLKALATPPNVIDYDEAVVRMDTDRIENNKIYPTIIPNWDQSPRKGIKALIYHNSTPDLFYKHVKMTLNRIKNKDDEDKIIFLKSWNEWAEGNYMEPDLKYGKGYIKALRKALDEFDNQSK